MAFGVTPDGFFRKTFTTIQKEIQDYLRVKISKHLTLDEKTGLGNVTNAAADQLAELWEVGEANYNGFDPDNAEDLSFVALCALTGTKRRGASKGVVLATCGFDGGQTYAPGALVAHVVGFADNRWVNRDTVVTTSPGSYTNLVFEAETAGAVGFCNAATLTVIAQTATGWNSIANPAAATPGQDIETIEALSIRREQELQISDAGPLPAIRAKVSRVPGVLQVKAQENKTDYWTALPPHSYRMIVWDGIAPAADNNAIAQAIVDSGCAGIQSVGVSSGTATDADGNSVVVRFDRATAVLIYVDVAIVGSPVGVAEAIVAEGTKLNVGDDVILDKLRGAAVALETVVKTTAFEIDNVPSPAWTSDIGIAEDQIAIFDVARVTVT